MLNDSLFIQTHKDWYKDENIHVNFNKFLDQYLNILLCNPSNSSCSTTTPSTDIVDVTNNNNNNSISMVSYQLIDTNEFQLYKLLALCSQSSLSSSSSSSTSLLPWANKLNSLIKWRLNEDHFLPNETLYFNQQYYCKTSNLNNMQNYKKIQFSLTTVCLARSIETLLHYQLYKNHNEKPSIQISLDLLRTTNEYLSTCLQEFNSIQVNIFFSMIQLHFLLVNIQSVTILELRTYVHQFELPHHISTEMPWLIQIP
ncbi:unnamed protein product [Schistosoma margrebowiei]|uniref:Uncharacterized protein n=1 Tax=Schistosoma margrebowiei TaxID=48269 RepID=A0A183MRU0_9TREM|nr:unnamed protein product [Schistosoma margrebowiei]